MRPDSDPPVRRKRAERPSPAVRPARRGRLSGAGVVPGSASSGTAHPESSPERRARLLRLPGRRPEVQDSEPKGGRRLKQLPRDRQEKLINWRYVSGGILVAVAALMIAIFISPIFYVTRIEVGGLRYVPPDEVFRMSEAANTHILWINPQNVKARIEESPSFDSVDVYVRWPARLQVVVREREPALIWEQGGNRYWVDVRGHLMPARRDLPGLVRVINEEDAIPFYCPGPACPEGEDEVTLDPALVSGSQQLKTLRTNIDVLYYSPTRGLSYQDGRGWRGYFGTGTTMDWKLTLYETIIADLATRGLTPTVIDVSNPDAPYYRVAE